MLRFVLHDDCVYLLTLVKGNIRSGGISKSLQVHRIFETQVGVGIVSKSHAHEHAIQNSRKSFNYKIETLLVCLEQLLLQLVFQFGAAVELAVLRRVQVFRDHIAC